MAEPTRTSWRSTGCPIPSATRASGCATTTRSSASCPRTSCACRRSAAWTAACRSATTACPLGNLIPDWNDLVRGDDWQAAIEQLHATNNFPEFTGLICPAPCESACVLDIDDDPVMIKQIEYAIVAPRLRGGLDQAESAASAAPARPSPSSAPAPPASPPPHELNQVGHEVTVYERDEAPGGLMRFGVPDAKLEKWMIDRRVALLEEEGVSSNTTSTWAATSTPRTLAAEHDAVILAIGSRVERDLEVPGPRARRRPLRDGVPLPAQPLRRPRRQGRAAREPEPGKEIVAEGKHVVVIGGGDTGMDCVSNANREGAESAILLDVYPDVPVGRPLPGHALAARAARASSPPTPSTRAASGSSATRSLGIEGEDGKVTTLIGRRVTGNSSRTPRGRSPAASSR